VGCRVVAVLRESMVLVLDCGVIRVTKLARIVVASVLPNARSVNMENTVLKPGRLQHAQIVRRARLRTAKVKTQRVLVVSVEQEHTLQKAPDFALPVMLESGQTPKESPLVRDAKTVQQTHILCLEATKYRGASAKSARLGRMGAHAQIVWQASTRQALEAPSAQNVRPASTPQPLGQHHQMFVATAAQALFQQLVPVHARIATTESTKMLQGKTHARRAQPESLQQTSMQRNLHALIVLLDAMKPPQERTRVSTNVVQVRTR